MPTPTEHAFLSASAAHRWLVCTAAPRFEAQFPESTSTYAEEGRLAHSVCEFYARRKLHLLSDRAFDLRLAEMRQRPYWSDEMLRTAQIYADYLAEKTALFPASPHVALEVRVDLSDYVPEGFGTCDCAMIGGDTLHITDYKHGKGVPVSAINNPQMRLYALGALKAYAPVYGGAIRSVSMGICQPRLTDAVEEDCLTVEDLRAWGERVKPIAREAYDGPGTFRPGEHCRFCRGKAKCRARADQNTALEDFKDCVPAGKAAPGLQNLSPEARTVTGVPPVLSDAEIGELLERSKLLVQWYNDLQAYATEALLAGTEIPGWKVVAGRSNRAFADEDAAMRTLIDAGYDEAMLYDRKPKTLTELEKMLGKKTFADLLGNQVVKPSGKPTLAPASDKRDPYSTATADFSTEGGDTV